MTSDKKLNDFSLKDNNKKNQLSYAYVTLVLRNENYVPGAIVLAKSLEKVQAKYPIICMITEDIEKSARKVLKKFFYKVKIVPYIYHRCNVLKTKRQRELYSDWIDVSFTKWNCLNQALFGEFDKVLFIDADMIMRKNCEDELFSLDTPAMTFSTPWCKPYLTDGIHNPYGEMPHGTKVSYEKVKQGFQSFVAIGSLVLIRPDNKVFEHLITCLNSSYYYGISSCYSGFDEQLICQTYCSLGYTFTHIHQSYNWCVGKFNWLPNLVIKNEGDPIDWGPNAPKIFHYYGDKKPWLISRNNQWNDTACWWSIADEIIAKSSLARKFFELENIYN